MTGSRNTATYKSAVKAAAALRNRSQDFVSAKDAHSAFNRRLAHLEKSQMMRHKKVVSKARNKRGLKGLGFMNGEGLNWGFEETEDHLYGDYKEQRNRYDAMYQDGVDSCH